MCGFVVSKDVEVNEKFIARRGPDLRSEHSEGGFNFIHFLLNCTGSTQPQPFVSDGIVCVYNGEIYNHPFESSDGEVLIPLYLKYGDEFPRYLDGEFSIALYDFNRNIVLLASDAFGTKPLWYKGAEVASYSSALSGGEQFPPNTIRVVNLNNGASISSGESYTFDFDNQDKHNYDDWVVTFESSISKRATDTSFVCLSSGYDSGVIACCLEQHSKVDWRAYSIPGTDNHSTIDLRFNKLAGKVLHPSRAELEAVWKWQRENVEPYYYRWRDYFKGKVVVNEKEMLKDRAVPGLGFIFEQATAEGKTIHLSGQGGDELYSDYGHSRTSELKGKFPSKLHQWGNFSGNQMRDYIHKEEHVGGAYGIETRYPLLDTALVQEFLWLSVDLKNKAFKAPLAHYMDMFNYPYVKGSKVGFNPWKGAK